MRIDAGLLKGRKIPLPKGTDIRPTSDKVKQALFNIVGPAIHGASVLDLFCGSGALGLEALSRGAGRVVFVDKDSRCTESVAKWLDEIAVEGLGEASILRFDAWRALGQLASQTQKFDLVLLDPPYAAALGSSILQSRELVAILARENTAQVMLEHSSKEAPQAGDSLGLLKSRRYGSTSLSFFGWRDRPAEGGGGGHED